jgi:hypothetical protein
VTRKAATQPAPHGHHAGPGHGRTPAVCAGSHEAARRAHKGKARDDNLRTAARLVAAAARTADDALSPRHDGALSGRGSLC